MLLVTGLPLSAPIPCYPKSFHIYGLVEVGTSVLWIPMEELHDDNSAVQETQCLTSWVEGSRPLGHFDVNETDW